jgi:hypothetical protein
MTVARWDSRTVRPAIQTRSRVAIVCEIGKVVTLSLLVGATSCTRQALREGPGLQGKSMATEHAVIVEFTYGLKDLGPLRETESRLDAAVKSAEVGEYDGDEIATDLSEGSLYMYGPDADRLFAAVRPVLESASFMRGAVVHVRYGPPGSPELRVTISSK